MPENLNQIRSGYLYLEDTSRGIQSCTSHKTKDIAICKLAEYSNIEPINIASEINLPNHGLIKAIGATLKGNVKRDSFYGYYSFIKQDDIGVMRFSDERSFCFGDSGGPTLIDGQIVGIHSLIFNAEHMPDPCYKAESLDVLLTGEENMVWLNNAICECGKE